MLFPSHPDGHECYFRHMHTYSGGVPMYLVHILRELVDLQETSKDRDLFENDIEALIDSILMDASVLIIPGHMSPETMNVVCSMLLVAVLELRIKQYSFVTIKNRGLFLLHVANALGFTAKLCRRRKSSLSS
ncbi:hypothetical protein GAYE_SCF37G5120 [Galdieria yellowstonensis]|uniref:Uncharacterized protein n=1 Tax=Galdieria yellowstonensis TaxID=3028027 RepID=A0AAV9IIU4_9RHOD|nr:hypothetical protein GAYE_SCF37G5120 [Galdieria yellowstonensis]